MMNTPFEKIQKSLTKELPKQLLDYLPQKWEKLGDIAIIKLPQQLKKYQHIIGETYASILHCKTVLNDLGAISGVYREPNIEILFGKEETETVHLENGIRFKLDPQKIMFSSGNMDERMRMATISNPNETVIDLFAGIGYFTLPIAVFSKPSCVIACEINPLAYKYLCQNIVLNHVSEIVTPLLGDNRGIAPENCANRVIMGYLEDTKEFLSVAFRCLKNGKGVIHYHEVVPIENTPDSTIEVVQETAETCSRNIKLLFSKHIKSYSPGRDHIVVDVEVW